MQQWKNEMQLSGREFKSSAFTAYFGIARNAAKLYQALAHSEPIRPEDIRFTTLEGVKTIGIPTPEFYVFYNGTQKQPAEQILKISDAYLEKTDEPMLELKVKVINVNLPVGHPILKECRPMFEYSFFIQQIREYMAAGDTRDKAIAKSMDVCLKRGIMVDFIEEYGSEVRNMLFTEFNMEDALEVRGAERYEEGKIEGRSEGKAEGKADEIRIIRNQLKKRSVSETAELLGLEEAYVKEIDRLCREYPKEPDSRIAARYLEEEK